MILISLNLHTALYAKSLFTSVILAIIRLYSSNLTETSKINLSTSLSKAQFHQSSGRGKL